MEFRKMVTITLYTRQQKRHWCIEQSYGLWGGGRGWEDLGEWYSNMYNIMYERSRQSRFDAQYWMLGAGALGRPRGMVWRGRREEGSGWRIHVYLWRIHFYIWKNQYNIVKIKKNNKIKKERKKKNSNEQRLLSWLICSFLHSLCQLLLHIMHLIYNPCHRKNYYVHNNFQAWRHLILTAFWSHYGNGIIYKKEN